ncbi:MAG: hypothetical protein WAU45_17455 [Blastocatellia bacterium]
MGRFDLKRSPLKLLRLATINLLVLFVLLETTSAVFYYLKTGEFFYSRKEGHANSSRASFETSFQQAANDMSIIYQFHPYFGFVYRQGYVQGPYLNSPNSSSYPANNFGFLSLDSFPFKKTKKNQFIIGVFGGSVATIFSFCERENHFLANALKRIPAFQNKEIIVLNFAAGGYKQPQQLLVLNYFLSIGQELDMVINIDGVNETEYWNNRFGVDVSMPIVHVALPLVDLANKDLSSEELTLSLEILQIKGKLRDAPARLDNRMLATSYALSWIQIRYLQSQYRKKAEAFALVKRNGQGKDSLIHLNRIEKPLDDSEAYEQMTNVWANSSLAMKELLSARNVLYFHFIQPNQYYPTGRQFSEEEKKIAIEQGNPLQESIANAYPKLLSRLVSLQALGVHAFSAVDAFDDVKDAVYADNTCHYNKLGNEALGNYIARRIIGVLQ